MNLENRVLRLEKELRLIKQKLLKVNVEKINIKLANREGVLKICSHCGSEYLSININQKYCCTSCKEKAMRLRNGEQKPLVRSTCVNCGEGYMQKAGNQKFCNINCRDIHSKK